MYSNYLEIFGMKDMYLTACLHPSHPFLPSFLLSFALSSFQLFISVWTNDIHTLGDTQYYFSFLFFFFFVIAQVVLAWTIGSFSVWVISSFVSFRPVYDVLRSPYIFLALVLKSTFSPEVPDSVCLHILKIKIWDIYLAY